MALPITPAFQADTVVLQRITIDYKPEWDGAAWILTPANISLQGIGQITSEDRSVANADIPLALLDLPAAGQTALQDLHTHVETAMQDKYTTPP